MTKSDVDYERLYEGLGFEAVRQDQHGNDIGHCFDPFGWHKHGDRTGKLIFYKDSERVSCFVCGGFTLERFTAIIRDTDDEDAEDWVAQFREGEVKSDEAFRAHIRDRLNYKYTPKRKGFPKPSSTVLENFDLFKKWDDLALAWAAKRGISEETANDLGLRYGNPRRMPPLGIEDDSYQGPAIIIPHYWYGELVGWQYRWILDKELPGWLQKYTNTKDFPKERTLFNFDRAKESDLPVIVCESVTTVAWLHENGLPSTATFGARVTGGQVRELRKCQQGLVLAPDNDAASYSWIGKLLPLSKFVPLKVLERVQIRGWNDGADLGNLAPDPEALFHHLSLL
jgi:hypothetical protein